MKLYINKCLVLVFIIAVFGLPSILIPINCKAQNKRAFVLLAANYSVVTDKGTYPNTNSAFSVTIAPSFIIKNYIGIGGGIGVKTLTDFKKAMVPIFGQLSATDHLSNKMTFIGILRGGINSYDNVTRSGLGTVSVSGKEFISGSAGVTIPSKSKKQRFTVSLQYCSDSFASTISYPSNPKKYINKSSISTTGINIGIIF